MKEIKVEWCKNFITKTFSKYPTGTGIERNLFFKMAELQVYISRIHTVLQCHRLLQA